jgi:hypothetical protein
MTNIFTSLTNKNNPLQIISKVKQLANGDPTALYNTLLEQNPQFRSFVQANGNKTPEQIAKENGIDFNMIRKML